MTRTDLRTKLLADTILGTDTAFDLIEEIAAIRRRQSWSHAALYRLARQHPRSHRLRLDGPIDRDPRRAIPSGQERECDEARVYTRRLLDRFRALPGVEAVGAISNLHLNPLSTSSSEFNVDGFEPPTDHGAFIAYRAAVEPEFFEVVGIEILRGRNFNDADRPDTQPVVIIGEAMARRCWTDGDAVGRLVRRREDDPPWLVVGMASDAKVRTLGEAPRNMVYLPYSQRFTPLLTVVARTPIRPGAGRRA